MGLQGGTGIPESEKRLNEDMPGKSFQVYLPISFSGSGIAPLHDVF